MSNSLAVLVIGAGWIGCRHVEALKRTGRARVSVCDSQGGMAKAVAGEHGLEGSFETLDEALKQEWDAALVATPAPSHMPIGRRLTARGIPLLVEKPIALGPEGLDEWQAELVETGKQLMVGYLFRCHPVLIGVRTALGEGRIGRPLQVVARRGGNLPVRRPDYTSTYCARRETGGGVIQDILSHVYNAVEWLVGPMDRLQADAGHLCLPGVEVEDTVNVLARHGSVLASYAVNQHQPIAEFILDVHGESGSLRADFGRNFWAVANTPDGEWETHRFTRWTKETWFEQQAMTFLKMAEWRIPPPCSLEEAITTMHAIRATLRVVDAADNWTPVIPS